MRPEEGPGVVTEDEILILRTLSRKVNICHLNNCHTKDFTLSTHLQCNLVLPLPLDRILYHIINLSLHLDILKRVIPHNGSPALHSLVCNQFLLLLSTKRRSSELSIKCTLLQFLFIDLLVNTIFPQKISSETPIFARKWTRKALFLCKSSSSSIAYRLLRTTSTPCRSL